MTGRLDRLRIVSVALLLLVAAAGTPSREAEEKILPNFHKVNEQLYRGAQPLSGGMKELAARGIKTVINLRGEDERTHAEEADAKAAGLRYFQVPLPGFGRPRDEQVDEVLALINNPQNWPVFVHCHHGEDRTGTIIACYRISHDNWTSEKAKAEAKHYGMSWTQFAMKDYISDYYKRWSQHPAQKLTRLSSDARGRLLPQT